MAHVPFRIVGLLSVAVICTGATPPLPTLGLTLIPHATGAKIDRLNARLKIAGLVFAKGDTVLRMPLRTVSIPTAAYTTDALQVTDADGPVPLRQVDEAADAVSQHRHWTALRATRGAVTATFGTVPRQVDGNTRNGPLYDLRADGDGLTGAGLYFMAVPPDEQRKYRMTLRWDLSRAPAGTQAVWSRDKDSFVDTSDAFVSAYYLIGAIKSEPKPPRAGLTMYWITQPSFDITAFGTELSRIYRYATKFFADQNSVYRVFIRRNSIEGYGGTSFGHAFALGYPATRPFDPPKQVDFVTHEALHSWMQMEGDIRDVAWFNEGTAEFYAAAMTFRSGAVSLPDYLAAVNRRAAAYYTNPYRTLTNVAAGDQAWEHAAAQRIPYERGFMYLISVDAKIRAASHGRRSLDDLVQANYRIWHAGRPYTINDWLTALEREVGAGVRKDYEDMAAGRPIVLPKDALGPCLQLVQASFRPLDIGFDAAQMGKVTSLVADSPGARAGLQEGDEIVSMTPRKSLADDESLMMDMVIRRAGVEKAIRYLPRGEAVPGWK